MWWIALLVGFAAGVIFGSILTASLVDNYWQKKFDNRYYKCNIPYEIEPKYEREADDE